MMDIDFLSWGPNTRPCRVALSLNGGAVFADFDVDASTDEVFLVRISFDSGTTRSASTTSCDR
jgi:hypothetical protein